MGMIAEEVGLVLPEIVDYEENGIDAIGMDYSKLTPVLVEAVKTLKDQADRRQNQLTEKDREIATLRVEIESMNARWSPGSPLLGKEADNGYPKNQIASNSLCYRCDILGVGPERRALHIGVEHDRRRRRRLCRRTVFA